MVVPSAADIIGRTVTMILLSVLLIDMGIGVTAVTGRGDDSPHNPSTSPRAQEPLISLARMRIFPASPVAFQVSSKDLPR
jgi:hypothetical protein